MEFQRPVQHLPLDLRLCASQVSLKRLGHYKFMRKTDKKLENTLIAALKEVCEAALEEFDGFQWLTHFANYSCFPGSLTIVCIFDTNENLAKMYQKDSGDTFRDMIKSKLKSVDIEVKCISPHVNFDTEEECKKENDGKWHERFK
jgi:hypothetical protein